jgi:hypothetical protein
MPDGSTMFEPLAPDEQTGSFPVKHQAEKTPIVPVPADAPTQNYRDPRYGYPTAQYEYWLAGGELAGYACRFDFIRDNGQPDKEVLPVTYCDPAMAGAGGAKKTPEARPLYRLVDRWSRPDAAVIICEARRRPMR